jgi:hypothetical protein
LSATDQQEYHTLLTNYKAGEYLNDDQMRGLGTLMTPEEALEANAQHRSRRHEARPGGFSWGKAAGDAAAINEARDRQYQADAAARAAPHQQWRADQRRREAAAGAEAARELAKYNAHIDGICYNSPIYEDHGAPGHKSCYTGKQLHF